MKRLIYADHAATTPLSPVAFAAMLPFLTEDYYNPSTKYSSSRRARKSIEESRMLVASCLNAKANEIYFTSGGTESDNWAIKGTMFTDNDHRSVVTSAIEHHAVLNSCAAIEKMGYPVTYILPDSTGKVTPEMLIQCLSNRPKLVSIMMANNELGTIEPVEELADIAHKHEALFHTDAVQAVGHIPINVKALGIDMLSASAHKFGGPKGIGFLYIREGLQLEPLLSGGGQEHGYRAGTENVASIVGMAAALKESCASIDASHKHLKHLREIFHQELAHTSLDWQINGGNHVLPGTISLSIKGMEGEMLLHRLDFMGIQVATGSACDSKETQVSHVLKAINLQSEYASGTIRISLSASNTEEDVQYIVHSIAKIASKV